MTKWNSRDASYLAFDWPTHMTSEVLSKTHFKMHRCLHFLSQNKFPKVIIIKMFWNYKTWNTTSKLGKQIKYNNNILITISNWKRDMECFTKHRGSPPIFKLRIVTPGGAFVRTSGSRRSDCTPVRSRWLKSMMNAEVSRMALCPIRCYSDAQCLLWKIQTRSLVLTRTCWCFLDSESSSISWVPAEWACYETHTLTGYKRSSSWLTKWTLSPEQVECLGSCLKLFLK